MSLTVYPSYVESDIPWIDQKPAHWSEKPAFAVCREEAIKNSDGEETTVLSLSYGNIVIRNVEQNFGLLPESFNTYQIVSANDIILRLTDLQNDKRSLRVGLAKQRGIITSAYLKLTCNEELDPQFAYQLLHAYDITKVFYGMGGGLRQSMKFADFRRLPLLVPPLAEQKAIARFLDCETAKIDRLIEKQERLIALLKEKRQAVISHAVTKGLNPGAKLRDSGVEWLSEVPEHWVVCSLRRVIDFLEQGTSPNAINQPPTDNERGVLKVSSVKKGLFVEEECKTLDLSTPFDERFRVHKGDLLLTRANTPSLVADACVVESEPRCPIMMCDLVYRLNINNKVIAKFLCYWLLSNLGRQQIQLDARGSSMTMAKVSQEHIKNWVITLPETSEQNEIVEYLSKKEAAINKLVTLGEKAISALKERRSALISAAVTGKIDVRNWQPETTFAEAEKIAV